MARRFNGTSDYIVFTLPASLQAVTAGSTTMVFVANFSDGTDGAMVHTRTSGGTNCWWMEVAANVWNYGQSTAARNVGGQTSGSWAAYIGRKTTGGANAPRGRKIIFGGATTDTTAPSGLADGTAPGAGGILQVGKWGTASEFIAADVAAVAVFNSDLSDATTATFTTWQAILDASPVWAVHFDQANATDSITDATGGGGDSSSITGTTIVANPSGFFSSTVTVNAGSAAATAAGNAAALSTSPAAGSAAVAVGASGVTLLTGVTVNAGAGAIAVAAAGAALATRPSGGAGAATVAGNPAVLRLSPAAGVGAVGAAAAGAGLALSPSAGVGAAAAAGRDVALSLAPAAGFAAVSVGALDVTLSTAGGPVSLAAGSGAVAVGAFNVTLIGGDQQEGGGAVAGSWYGLLDVLREVRQVLAEERAAPLVACPNDGEPLESARGVLHCRFCGRTYSGNEQL